MRDHILESIFLDTQLWEEVVEHALSKKIPAFYPEILTDPRNRAEIAIAIGEGRYQIQPPHTGYRRKDDGTERMFLINSPEDRLILNAIYKWLMKNESNLIHPTCKSYQSGIGTGKIVKDIAAKISYLANVKKETIVGRKFDVHKYFESIPRERIREIFSYLEKQHGESSIIDLLREYYESDLYYDSRTKKEVEHYEGIKQGSAVSAWLANVILYPLDEEISHRNGIYVRYSDDILYIGEDYEEVTQLIEKRLAILGLKLKKSKICNIRAGQHFCFLGYDIFNDEITLSKKWVKNFQEEIDRRTIKNLKLIKKIRAIPKEDTPENKAKRLRLLQRSIRRVMQFLIYGNGRYSWATQVLPVVNNKEDLLTLSKYCLDCLRAVYTGHTHVGGLGKSLTSGITRGRGRNMASNLKATAEIFDNTSSGLGIVPGYISIVSLKNLIGNKWLLRTLGVSLLDTRNYPLYGDLSRGNYEIISQGEMVETLERLYENYLYSQPNNEKLERFYALSLEDLTMELLIKGQNRNSCLYELQDFLIREVDFDILTNGGKSWFWQSQRFPQFILLREWFKS